MSDSTAAAPRKPWQITRSVWFAMFMRETIARTTEDRLGWFWMVFEPVAYTLIMVAIRSFIRGDRLIVNADFIPWLITGLLGFFLVREGMMRGMNAVNSNSALFTYRQVQPVDPVLVRNFFDGMLRTFVFIMFIAGAVLLGIELFPDKALQAMLAWLSLWVLGLGAGLVVSVAATLIPEIGRIVQMLSLPLLILSGVIFPLNHLPHWLLEYLMWNPIPHGVEVLRRAFFDGYVVVHGTSLTYFWFYTLATLALGMLMHVRFASRLKAL